MGKEAQVIFDRSGYLAASSWATISTALVLAPEQKTNDKLVFQLPDISTHDLLVWVTPTLASRERATDWVWFRLREVRDPRHRRHTYISAGWAHPGTPDDPWVLTFTQQRDAYRLAASIGGDSIALAFWRLAGGRLKFAAVCQSTQRIRFPFLAYPVSQGGLGLDAVSDLVENWVPSTAADAAAPAEAFALRCRELAADLGWVELDPAEQQLLQLKYPWQRMMLLPQLYEIKDRLELATTDVERQRLLFERQRLLAPHQ